MNNEEYVLIPLSIFESKEWAEKREFSKAEAWIWLLVNANRTNKDLQVITGKNTICVKFGQIHITNRTLADIWGWSSSSVNRYIDKLVIDGRVKKVNIDNKLGTLIHICGFEQYFDIED